jgi:hypothetical protein
MLFFVTIICGYGGVFEETPAYVTSYVLPSVQSPQWIVAVFLLMELTLYKAIAQRL